MLFSFYSYSFLFLFKFNLFYSYSLKFLFIYSNSLIFFDEFFKIIDSKIKLNTLIKYYFFKLTFFLKNFLLFNFESYFKYKIICLFFQY